MVDGGVAGEAGATCDIRLKGTFRARYTQNARIEAGQDVLVRYSILHSIIKAGGKVVVDGQKGQIAGGEVEAIRGIECTEVGTERGRRTTLILAKRRPQDDGSSLHDIQHLDQEIRRLSERIDPILSRVPNVDVLPTRQRALIRKCLECRDKLMARRRARARVLQLADAKVPQADEAPYVRVTGPVHPGVRIVMGDRYIDVGAKMSGVLFLFEADEIHVKALSDSSRPIQIVPAA